MPEGPVYRDQFAGGMFSLAFLAPWPNFLDLFFRERKEPQILHRKMLQSAQLGALPRIAAPEKATGPVHSGTRNPRVG